MKTLKIILGILAIIPASLIIASIADPKFIMHNPAAEWVFTLVGIPIFVFNLWVWTEPEILKTMFNLKD